MQFLSFCHVYWGHSVIQKFSHSSSNLHDREFCARMKKHAEINCKLHLVINYIYILFSKVFDILTNHK